MALLRLTLVASALVAIVSLVVLILAYPLHGLDHVQESNCHKLENALGQPVATVCDTQAVTATDTTMPVSRTAIEQPAPSTGIRIR